MAWKQRTESAKQSGDNTSIGSFTTTSFDSIEGQENVRNSFLHYIETNVGAHLKFEKRDSHTARVASGNRTVPLPSDDQTILANGYYITAKKWGGVKAIDPMTLKKEFELALRSINSESECHIKITEQGVWIGEGVIDDLLEGVLADAQSQTVQFFERNYKGEERTRYVNAIPEIFRSSALLNHRFIRTLAIGLGDRSAAVGV